MESRIEMSQHERDVLAVMNLVLLGERTQSGQEKQAVSKYEQEIEKNAAAAKGTANAIEQAKATSYCGANLFDRPPPTSGKV